MRAAFYNRRNDNLTVKIVSMNEEEQQSSENAPEKKKNPLVTLGVVAAAVVAGVMLIPDVFDVIPIAGWIDEAAAIAILIACFGYFGFDVKGILGKFGKEIPEDTKPARGKVLDSDSKDA